MTEKINIKLKQLSMLNSISEEGSKKASEALSIMTHPELSVEIFDSEVIPIEKLSSEISLHDIVTSIYLKITGDLSGGIVIMLDDKSSLALIDMLLGQKIGTTVQLDSMGESALKETGNILAGHYLSALSDYLKVSVIESVPDFKIDSADSIINTIAVDLSQETSDALIFEMKFTAPDKDINGQMLIFFDAKSAQTIKDKLLENN